MDIIKDKVAAVECVREIVYAHLHEGRLPQRLAKMLIDLLVGAVERGTSKSKQLARDSAAKGLGTTTRHTSFKEAVTAVAVALGKAELEDRKILLDEVSRPGFGCVIAPVGGIKHLVIVRGPTAEHRGVPEDGQLRLSVEFRPLGPLELAVARRYTNMRQPRNAVFTGREELLAALAERRIEEARRPDVHVLYGLGGVGKTHVAMQFAHLHADLYPVVWWVRATDRVTAQLDCRLLAQELGLADETTRMPDVLALLFAWLEQNTSWLLIFDSAPDVEAIREVLPSVGSGRILITSLNHAWHSLGTVHEVRSFSEDDAVKFLRRRTRRFDDDPAELAGELGLLPLALEHAAAYIDALGISFSDYLLLYRAHRSKLLTRGESHLSPVVTTWSITLAEVATQNLLALQVMSLASVLAAEAIPRVLLDVWAGRTEQWASGPGFHGSMDAELGVSDAIVLLRRYSLVYADTSAVIVHRLLHDVVVENLDISTRRVFERAAIHLLLYLLRYDAVAYHDPVVAGELLGHVRQVTTVTEFAGYTPSLHLMTLLARFFDEHGYFDEAATILNEAAHRARSNAVEQWMHVAIETKLAAVYRTLRKPKDAMAAIGRATKVVARSEPRTQFEIATSVEHLNTAAVLCTDAGDTNVAIALLRKALERVDSPEVQPHRDELESLTRANLGAAMSHAGRHVEAVDHLENAVMRDRGLFGRSHPTVALRLSALGNALLRAERVVEARAALHEAWQIHLEAHGEQHPNTIKAQMHYAQGLMMLGDYEQALPGIDNALRIGTRLQLFLEEEFVRIGNLRAMCLEQLGRIDEALKAIDEAVDLARRIGSPSIQLLESNREHILGYWRSKGGPT